VLIDSGRIEQFQSKRNGVVINKDNSADKYPEGMPYEEIPELREEISSRFDLEYS